MGVLLSRRDMMLGAAGIAALPWRARGASPDDWAITRPPTDADRVAIAEFRTGKRPWTFSETFTERAVFDQNFIALTDAEASLKSCRSVSDVIVENNNLVLRTSADPSCAAKWTTGSVKTRSFRQKYGFFEAQLRTTAASGINNAFWLWGADPVTRQPLFEIDVVEAHYPHRAIFTVHDWRPPHRSKSVPVDLAFDHSQAAHEYSALWRPNEVIFAVDGKPYAVIVTNVADGEADFRFSTAVTSYAGEIGPNLAGTDMRIKWVHVASL